MLLMSVPKYWLLKSSVWKIRYLALDVISYNHIRLYKELTFLAHVAAKVCNDMFSLVFGYFSCEISVSSTFRFLYTSV